MNSEKNSELFSFESEITDNGEVIFPAEKLKQIKNKGYSKIKISVFGDAKKAAVDTGINPILFEKIQSMQSLPQIVVFDFLKSKGSLRNSDFTKRIES